MMDKMITYLDPLDLDSNPEFLQHKGSLHICSTDSLRKEIFSKYQECDPPIINAPILSAGILISHLLSEWTSSKVKLIQYARLTEVLRSFKIQHPDKKSMLKAFRLNQSEILQTIRILIEAGVKPQDFNVVTEEEDLFVNLWDEFEKREFYLYDIREKLQTELSGNSIKEALIKALDNIPGIKNKLEDINEIVLHGFYFITPLQHKIFSLFKQGGINLIFLNMYDPKYPKTFGSIDAFVSDSGWVSKADWIIEQSKNTAPTWGDFFSSSFEESEQLISPENDLSIVSFKDFSSFLSHYEKDHGIEKPSYRYYSPSNDLLNERIKEYYPEHYKNRHFLAYPVGQFLFHLHTMWDENAEKLVMNERSLFECFASGWLQADGKNARNYTTILRDIIPFFSSCSDISQWREQCEILMSFKLNAFKAFNKYENTDSPLDRFHKMMGNPLLRFSFLNVDEEDLIDVFKFMEKMFTIAERLFDNPDSKTKISSHFKKIEDLIGDGILDQEFLDEEKEIIQELMDRLRVDFNDAEAFYTQDLSEAISLYLGGLFEDDENKTGILNYADIDGAMFHDGEVHLCAADEESLPDYNLKQLWPLRKETINNLTNFPELNLILLRELYSPEINRYLYHSLLRCPKVVLSWIEQWNEKNLKESIYLSLLNQKPEFSRVDFTKAVAEDFEIISEDIYSAIEQISSFPLDAAAEFVLCPRRFYYSFIAQDYACYTEDFHHQFLFGNLIKACCQLSDMDEAELYNKTSHFFPQWSDVKKRDLFEQAVKYKVTFNTYYDRFDGKDYVKGRRLFQFLLPNHKDDLKKVNETFKTEGSRKHFLSELASQNNVQMDACPSVLCRYCPHLKVCIDGLNPVDDRR